jgi:hypothetical protein
MIVQAGVISVLLAPDQTVVRRRPNEVTATDDEQQPGIGVLLLDDC